MAPMLWAKLAADSSAYRYGRATRHRHLHGRREREHVDDDQHVHAGCESLGTGWAPIEAY